MPVYEYECGTCRLRFDLKHGFEEAPKVMCPKCQGKTRRILQSSPVIFKGSGFYITDSRKNAETDTAAKADTAPKTETAPKANTTPKANTAPKTDKAPRKEAKGK